MSEGLNGLFSVTPSRVGIVTGDFALTGGMDRANYALAEYLARQGIRVDLVAHRVAPELLAYPNVTFHRVPKPANSNFLGAPLLSRAGNRVGKLVAKDGGRMIVNGGNCRFYDVNWVHYLHAAYQPEMAPGLRKIRQAFERPMALRNELEALRNARLIIANSESTKNAIIDQLGIAAEKIKVVYYGIDRDRFRPAGSEERQQLRMELGWDDSPRVVFIGALGDRRKGFALLAAAWMEICQQPDWDAKLVVVGTGSERARWEAMLGKVDRSESVQFLGFRSDVPKILRAADCLFAPTLYEAYGLGVHEAICCGLPAFVTSAAGVAERFPKEASELLLSTESKDKPLATALAEWGKSPSRFQSIAHPMSDAFRERGWDQTASNILALLQ
ncbi:glycosyltransferase family 4 protein [Novipirellula sp. SH528]|uniref:glycosyltransferase family 4 protein n=1 Tax=Novipirellula sp. SH528 TaxID=3454466 RepID=UPI003FA0CCEF